MHHIVLRSNLKPVFSVKKQKCFSKYSGSQGMSRQFERERISRSMKFAAIKSLREPDHHYISLFVCRNPVEKLLSVYNFMRYQVLENEKNMMRKNMRNKNPPDWQKYFPRNSPPSWEEFLTKIASGFTGFDGLTDSLYNKCSPCHYYYNAVIYMESFEEDSKYVNFAIAFPRDIII